MLCPADEKEDALNYYREYNEDYEAVEKEYQTYYSTYLTEEEILSGRRYEKLKLVNEAARQYGRIHHMTIREQECRIVVGEMSLMQVPELAEYLEKQENVSHVEITDMITEAEEGKNHTITAELIVVWKSPEVISAEKELWQKEEQ